MKSILTVHSECDPNPGFVLKDYNNKTTFPKYKGRSSRKRFPDNINNMNNNIFDLPGYRSVSANRKKAMFSFIPNSQSIDKIVLFQSNLASSFDTSTNQSKTK